MITFSNIGYFGRFGNQMFQFASTLGVGRKLGHGVKFPSHNTTNPQNGVLGNGKPHTQYFELPNCFNIDGNLLGEVSYKHQYNETKFGFSDDVFSIPDETNLRGYFQAEKYFKHVEDEIRTNFTFKDEIREKSLSLFPKLEYETVGIHIRLNDYLSLSQYHPVCSVEYYNEALKNFSDKNYYFIVFSDDKKMAKEIFGESQNLLYIDNENSYVDMCLMSMCNHNIIANSSFSWWGAWLNPNPDKRVVAPKQWFGPAYNHHYMGDLYCEGWVVV